MEPRGWVRVRGELWRAEGDGAIAAGEEVVIIAADGMRLVVRAGDPDCDAGLSRIAGSP